MLHTIIPYSYTTVSHRHFIQENHRIIINNAAGDSWVNIESKQFRPQNLFSSLFTKHNLKVSSFVINSTVKSRNKISNIGGVECRTTRNTQIWNNPSIKLKWDTWSKNGIKCLSDIIKNIRVHSLIELQNKFTPVFPVGLLLLEEVLKNHRGGSPPRGSYYRAFAPKQTIKGIIFILTCLI